VPSRQPPAASAASRPLIEAYARAWERVEDLQASIADDPRRWRQAAKLAEAQRAIEASLDGLDAMAQDWFTNEFPRVHAMGVNAGARELLAPAGQVWDAINPEAVSRLANEGFDDLLRSTRLTRRTTKDLIRRVVGDEALQKAIQGDTAVAAARRARKLLADHGIYSVVYSDGTKVGLKQYASMAVRTKTAQAYNLGTIDAGRTQGVDKWEIFDGDCGLTTHDGPTCNGLIVTGDIAMAYPISHPNCQRAFGARPDLSAGFDKRVSDQDLAAMTDEEKRLARNEASRRSKAKAKARKEAEARARTQAPPPAAAETELQKLQREMRETMAKRKALAQATREAERRLATPPANPGWPPAPKSAKASVREVDLPDPPPPPKPPDGWPPPPRAKGRSTDQTKRLPPDAGRTPADAARRSRFEQELPELGDRSAANALRGANPRYRDGQEYRVNCTNTVTAYELRRRGYDVSAAGLQNNTTGRSIQDFMDAWGGDARRVADNPAFDRDDLIRTIKADMPDGARGFAMVVYNSGMRRGGHIFSWEYHGGKVHWIDPQTGQAFKEADNFLFDGATRDLVMYGRLDDMGTYSDLMEHLA